GSRAGSGGPCSTTTERSGSNPDARTARSDAPGVATVCHRSNGVASGGDGPSEYNEYAPAVWTAPPVHAGGPEGVAVGATANPICSRSFATGFESREKNAALYFMYLGSTDRTNDQY